MYEKNYDLLLIIVGGLFKRELIQRDHIAIKCRFCRVFYISLHKWVFCSEKTAQEQIVSFWRIVCKNRPEVCKNVHNQD